MKTLVVTAGLAALLAVSASAQIQDEYLDYYIVKVKPEKRAEFDAIAKKIVDANRKNHGDNWLAFETTYGDNNTVSFVSSRKDMAAIDTGMESFMKAMKASYGPTFESIFHDMDACTISSRSEIRRRRPDLSSIPHPDDMMKYVGEARWIRVAAVRVRPGHIPEYEEMVRMIKAAREKANPEAVVAVSQGVVGQNGATFYTSTLRPSLGSYDAKMTPLKELLGDADYEKYQKMSAETVIGVETMMGRMLPALSNPPEEIVNVSRDYWIPKPATMVAARAKQPKKTADKTKP